MSLIVEKFTVVVIALTADGQEAQAALWEGTREQWNEHEKEKPAWIEEAMDTAIEYLADDGG